MRRLLRIVGFAALAPAVVSLLLWTDSDRSDYRFFFLISILVLMSVVYLVRGVLAPRSANSELGPKTIYIAGGLGALASIFIVIWSR